MATLDEMLAEAQKPTGLDALLAEAKKPQKRGLMQTADDAIRLAASGMTAGYADKIASYLGGTPLEEERGKTEAARNRLGLLGTGASVGLCSCHRSATPQLGQMPQRQTFWREPFQGRDKSHR